MSKGRFPGKTDKDWTEKMKIFDTHVHYDDQAFDPDRDRILNSLAEGHVTEVTDIGCSVASSRAAVELAEQYPWMYAAVGIIPGECGNTSAKDLDTIREMAGSHPKVRAIGEIGLDYHYPDGPSREKQQEVFRQQLRIAAELSLPFVIHSRDAAADTVRILQEEGVSGTGDSPCGVMHCYSYTWETAKILMKMGFYFGIGGVVTFRNSRKIKNVVENLPLERIVLETDCPYLAPEPVRGTRNDSRNLIHVIREISALKKIPAERVAEITYQNAEKLYRLG